MKSIIGDAALVGAFKLLEPYSSPGLAVSGGPDSMALMLLARRWVQIMGRSAQSTAVLTVDHGLRTASANEAAFVAKEAERLGFRHAILSWKGDKPKTGIQVAARRARYGLMADFCRGHCIDCLVTAHTQNDQAETLLMRLRRGSGLDGLAAMAAVSDMHGVRLVRPLLGFSKARLVAYLKRHAASFIGDPSNANDSFERVRLRHAMQACASAGIASPALVRSASRLDRARTALCQLTDQFLESELRVQLLGQAEIDRRAFEKLPAELALRVLSRTLALVGGREDGPRMAKVERVLSFLRGPRRQIALGGCLIAVSAGKLDIYREPGRMRDAILAAEAGISLVWDGRFVMNFSPRLESGLTLAPLGRKGWDECRKILKEQGKKAELNRLAALTAPVLWKEGRFAGAPSLAFADASLNGPSGFQAKVDLVPRLSHFLNAE